MKALVIGGTGPTGPFVLDGLLERGYRVTMLHRGTHEIDLPSGIEHLHGDPHFVEPLNEALGSRTFDVVIAMYGRLRFVAEVMRGRTGRLICAGGAAVYRRWHDPEQRLAEPSYLIPEDAPVTDSLETNGSETDAFSRFSNLMVKTELAVMESHDLGFYSATLLRFPMIYGPRQLIPGEWSIIRRVLDRRKRLIVPDSGLVIESRGYSENMAHGLLLCVDHPDESAGQVYNVADEDALSLKNWVEIISEIMDCRLELAFLPAKLATPSMPYAMPLRPFAEKTGELHHRVLDLRKIKAQLGYRDRFNAKDGLNKTVQYYLDNPPDRGGEIEQRLRDLFDYDAEDRLIAAYEKSLERLSDVFPDVTWRHPYPHPVKPNVNRDQRGR